MSTAEVPSEAARQAFVAKLRQFRGTLDASEQHMLDGLVTAAVAGREPEDVELYSWAFGSTMPGSGLQPDGGTADMWTTNEGGNNPFKS
jgi:hypothetical protein